MVTKVRIEPNDRSEDARDLIEVLDRILDKGIVVDLANRLDILEAGLLGRLGTQGDRIRLVPNCR